MGLFRRLVTSISKAGDTKLKGDVTLSEGSNITLTRTGNNIEVSASGSGGAGISSLLSIFDDTNSMFVTFEDGTIMVGE